MTAPHGERLSFNLAVMAQELVASYALGIVKVLIAGLALPAVVARLGRGDALSAVRAYAGRLVIGNDVLNAPDDAWEVKRVSVNDYLIFKNYQSATLPVFLHPFSDLLCKFLCLFGSREHASVSGGIFSRAYYNILNHDISPQILLR